MTEHQFGRRTFVQSQTPEQRFRDAKKPVQKPDTASSRNLAWLSYNFLLVVAVMTFQPQTAAAAASTVKAILPM